MLNLITENGLFRFFGGLRGVLGPLPCLLLGTLKGLKIPLFWWCLIGGRSNLQLGPSFLGAYFETVFFITNGPIGPSSEVDLMMTIRFATKEMNWI